MGTSDGIRRIGYPIAAFVLILADQIAKKIAVDRGSYVLNTGISFGFLRGSNAIMIVVATIALLLFVYLLAFRDKEFHSDVGLLLLIAGTAGNLIDRITIGAVVDFVRVPFDFPTFNFSDAYLTLGIAIIIVATIVADRTSATKGRPTRASGPKARKAERPTSMTPQSSKEAPRTTRTASSKPKIQKTNARTGSAKRATKKRTSASRSGSKKKGSR